MSFCRLCLNTVSDRDLKEIGKNEIHILDSLLIDMNLNTTKRYVMCEHCLKRLGALYTFKTMCLSTENCIPPFVKKEMLTQDDLTEKIKKEKDCDSLVKLCRLCLKFSSTEVRSVINDSDEDAVLYMINRCIPEIDMGVIEEYIICKNCYTSLKDFISFMNKCIETENRIDYFCHINAIDKNDNLNLSDVVEFKSKNDILLAKETDMFNDLVNDKINSEVNHEYNQIYIKPERVEIKLENQYEGLTGFEDNDMKMGQTEAYPILFPMESNLMYTNFDGTVNVSDGGFPKIETLACDLCKFIAKSEKMLLNHRALHSRYFTCDICGFQTRKKNSLVNHFWRVENPDKEQTYKCRICFFHTRYKNCLAYHIKIHYLGAEKTFFKCDMCNFKTPNRRYLTRHMVSHKDFSETEIYKCHLCSYSTRQKLFLRSHVSKHGAPQFECHLCPYKAKYRSCFRRHMDRWHKDDSERQRYHCYFCAYQTFDREGIVRHLLTHKDPSKVQKHKCDVCGFETSLKVIFKRHMDNHRDPQLERKPEDLQEPYKCELCEYKTNEPSNLKGHKLIHKPEQPSTYNCDSCSYTTLKKSSLRRHVARHKSPQFECYICQFKTINKSTMVQHMMKHKEASKEEMYRCAECDYETMNKKNLKNHVKRHDNKATKRIYTCEMCGYQTDRMIYFKRHVRKSHRIKSE